MAGRAGTECTAELWPWASVWRGRGGRTTSCEAELESRIDSQTRRGHGYETAENPPPAPHAASPGRSLGHPLVLCGPSETAVGVLLGSREELGFLRADPPEIGVPAQSPEPRIPPGVYRMC